MIEERGMLEVRVVRYHCIEGNQSEQRTPQIQLNTVNTSSAKHPTQLCLAEYYLLGVGPANPILVGQAGSTSTQSTPAPYPPNGHHAHTNTTTIIPSATCRYGLIIPVDLVILSCQVLQAVPLSWALAGPEVCEVGSVEWWCGVLVGRSGACWSSSIASGAILQLA